MDMEYMAAILSDISDIPMYEYDHEGKMLRLFCHHSDELTLPVSYRDLVEGLLGQLVTGFFAYAELPRLPICMCACRCEDASGFRYFIWGPVRYRHLNFFEKNIHDKLKTSEKHKLEPFMCRQKRLISEVACFLSAVNDRKVSVEEIQKLIDSSMTENTEASDEDRDGTKLMDKEEERLQYRVKQEDDYLINHTYAEEQVMHDIIRSGDVERMRRLQEGYQENH